MKPEHLPAAARWRRRLAAALAVLALQPGGAAAAEDFYKGRTVRIVVGLTAGGGSDTYARTFARYMGKYIPGNPTFIVENMPGAGSLISANHVYRAAKPDGLTIGNFLGGLLLGQILGRPGIEFDAMKFGYLGAPMKDNAVCAFTKASGITSVDAWLAAKTPVKLGATGPGATTHDVAMVLRTLRLPIQVVSGFRGAPELQLALENGELGGLCNAWESLRVASSRAIRSGDLVVVLQATPAPHPELPGVPLIAALAKTDDERQLIQAGVYDTNAITRPYVVPPGTPKDRLQMLRRAFAETLKDPQFIADAAKSRLDIDPITGEEFERIVERLFRMSPATLAQMKEILK